MYNLAKKFYVGCPSCRNPLIYPGLGPASRNTGMCLRWLGYGEMEESHGGNDHKTVKMEDTKVPRVKEFKYLGSTVQESGSCERKVKKRVQAGWNGWRRVSGVICDRRLPE